MVRTAMFADSVTYFDTAATVPMHPAARAAMIDAMDGDWANASSPHRLGRRVAGAVASHRKVVAGLMGTTPGRLVFTSGATEALNAAIKSCAARRPTGRIVIGATEHKAALAAALASADVVSVPVDCQGRPDLERADHLVGESPCAALVLMAVNNETGVEVDTARVADIGRRHDVPTIVDATQQLWRSPVLVDERGLDYVAVSAHKIGGPKGVGALVVPAGRPDFVPLLHGGDHEGGRRSGTINGPGIAGFAAAAAEVDRVPELEAVVERIFNRLSRAFGAGQVEWHAREAKRAPGFLNVRLIGIDADAMVSTTPTVAFATGSACQSDTPAPSHVLTAMGISSAAADESVRITPHPGQGLAEVDAATDALVASAVRIKELQ